MKTAACEVRIQPVIRDAYNPVQSFKLGNHKT